MSLYNFVDTNEQPLYTDLPSEALCYDGKYIDEEISLFRTLYVSGRESFSAEITETALESLDGSVFLRRRLLPRTIIVGYQMTASSAEELTAAYNHLNYLMQGVQVQVAFADEPDKYYIGTCKSAGTPERGKLSVKAEMEIYCADPCKYAVEETTVSPNSDGEFVVEYQGTYPARPTFTATFSGSAKQAVFTGDNAIVTAGDADSDDAVFAAGDTVEINCEEAKIYLNDTDTPALGDIANEYENMVLSYGTNTISPTYTGATPAFTMTYREAWL